MIIVTGLYLGEGWAGKTFMRKGAGGPKARYEGWRPGTGWPKDPMEMQLISTFHEENYYKKN